MVKRLFLIFLWPLFLPTISYADTISLPQQATTNRDASNNATATTGHQSDYTPVEITNRLTPVYPADAIYNHEQGKVRLRVSVGANGVPLSTVLLQSSGFPDLDKAVQESVLGWEYLPATVNGKPVAGEINLSYVYQIQPID